MSKMHWFRCYPENFLEGTMGMGPRLGWAYTRLLMAMYAGDGHIEYDPQKLKFLFEMRPQDVRRIIRDLVELGKIMLVGNQIHNLRADQELNDRKNLFTKFGKMEGQMELSFFPKAQCFHAGARALKINRYKMESGAQNGHNRAPHQHTKNDWDMPPAPGPRGRTAFLRQWKESQ